MNISPFGVQFIKSFEKCRLKKYKDDGGKDTIGWGHLIRPGENYEEITQAEADDLFLKDLQDPQNCINRWVKAPLKQCQFDALVSLIFNIGSGRFIRSGILKQLNAGNYNAAVIIFNDFKWITNQDGGKEISPGLVSRRLKEQELFNGHYN